MLKFELTHKCTLIQPLFLFSTWTACSRGRGLCTFRMDDVTNPKGSLCSPYQPFVVVLFFKSKYLPLNFERCNFDTVVYCTVIYCVVYIVYTIYILILIHSES